jgi:hypothetical protein
VNQGTTSHNIDVCLRETSQLYTNENAEEPCIVGTKKNRKIPKNEKRIKQLRRKKRRPSRTIHQVLSREGIHSDTKTVQCNEAVVRAPVNTMANTWKVLLIHEMIAMLGTERKAMNVI